MHTYLPVRARHYVRKFLVGKWNGFFFDFSLFWLEITPESGLSVTVIDLRFVKLIWNF